MTRPAKITGSPAALQAMLSSGRECQSDSATFSAGTNSAKLEFVWAFQDQAVRSRMLKIQTPS